ncbi:hypothetical protein [Halotalea alkalilenta]|uniref:Uncharacterized protein n=1 Tax=Halotalea alkalilenta TaxID=376489 RepID=A0A172YEC0_9GAMM|nr:hypothetical protein [Halotalea alkalilenta]ANF57547.1 hypothetical protein A5892_08790 [Halotalea alkalilenta]
MTESATHSSQHDHRVARRRHPWWLTGLLVGCLLPMAISSAMLQYRLDLMTERLVRIAFQVPETIRAVSRRRSVRPRRCPRPPRRRVRVRATALPRVPFIPMTSGCDVLSRRGPPACAIDVPAAREL